jgi:acetyl-CoA C-acetyltransferase
MSTDPVVIVSAARTPMGALLGDFKDLSATALGSVAISAAVARAAMDTALIDEAYMGCVLPAGLGQAPARQAALGAGLGESTACTTVSKVCGSGLKAVMLAHDAIAAGSASVVVAGGMESMTGAPHLLPKARSGYRLGNDTLYDHMFLDGLQDAYDKGKLMGVFAEQCAQHYQFTREAQDAFALTSLERAKKASASAFVQEIAPVTVKGKKGDTVIALDEQPQKADPAKIPTLKPAFASNGTVTAANASSISDGAAALVLMRASQAEKLGLTPLARILGHSSHAQAPAWFATAPIGAMQKLADKTGIALSQYDLFEINEAFAVVTMAAMRDLDLPQDKVNIHGGACALGHPIGASGARILVTLLHALAQQGAKRGMASLCIGGGEAVAMAVERIS